VYVQANSASYPQRDGKWVLDYNVGYGKGVDREGVRGHDHSEYM